MGPCHKDTKTEHADIILVLLVPCLFLPLPQMPILSICTNGKTTSTSQYHARSVVGRSFAGGQE